MPTAQKKMFMVMGVMDTGSGSLTYPEDFDFVGVFEDEEEANALAREKNKESGINDDPDSEDFDDGNTGEMRYEVEELPVLSRKR